MQGQRRLDLLIHIAAAIAMVGYALLPGAINPVVGLAILLVPITVADVVLPGREAWAGQPFPGFLRVAILLGLLSACYAILPRFVSLPEDGQWIVLACIPPLLDLAEWVWGRVSAASSAKEPAAAGEGGQDALEARLAWILAVRMGTACVAIVVYAATTPEPMNTWIVLGLAAVAVLPVEYIISGPKGWLGRGVESVSRLRFTPGVFWLLAAFIPLVSVAVFAVPPLARFEADEAAVEMAVYGLALAMAWPALHVLGARAARRRGSRR